MTHSMHPEFSEGLHDGWRGWLADGAAALALLSILPLPSRWQKGAAWPRALRMLPMAGALTGLLTGLVLWGLAWMLPHLPLAVVVLAMGAGIILSGAIHEDGLADVADALGGCTRQQRLDIMHDPRIGSFGVLALMFVLALQAAALLHLLQGEMTHVVAMLMATHGSSRLAAVWLMFALPAARGDGMSASAGRPSAAVLVQAALTLALVLLAAAPWLAGTALPVALLCGAVMALAMTLLFHRLLGGQTGDAAGAVEVTVRTAMLLGLAAN